MPADVAIHIAFYYISDDYKLTPCFWLLQAANRNVRLLAVAHSMGNQILTMALASPEMAPPMHLMPEIGRLLPKSMAQRRQENYIAFAAPDVDKRDFLDRVPYIKRIGHCCLYAACNDRALLLSCIMRGFHPRAGAVGLLSGLPLTGAAFDTVDCTGRRAGDPIGHSYLTGVGSTLPKHLPRHSIRISQPSELRQTLQRPSILSCNPAILRSFSGNRSGPSALFSFKRMPALGHETKIQGALSEKTLPDQ